MKVWEEDFYHEVARKGSMYVMHAGMQALSRIAEKSALILDMGCGEGTRLSIISKGRGGVGVDISKNAIKKAKKRFPKLEFICANLESLPFEDEKFDLVYSAFVLEHLSNPEKVIKEGIRVLKRPGKLVLIAPNYGAPNRASPVYMGSRIEKLLFGILSDIKRIIVQDGLNWQRVKPIATGKKYQVDWDTTVEPYIGSLIPFLKRQGLDIVAYNSVWEEELSNPKIHQMIFRLFSRLGIYPFKFWGPHLVVVAKK